MPTGIYSHKPRTEETKKRISEAKKSQHLKLPEEQKRRLAEYRKGKHHSEETKGKMSRARKGKPLSEETKRKISEARKGNKAYNWKGGITPENVKIRNSIEVRLWRESVFARDNWTCQKCEQRGRELNAHHIKNFADCSEFRTSIENGMTLCKKCHREFHRIYGKRNNTREQLKEFLLK